MQRFVTRLLGSMLYLSLLTLSWQILSSIELLSIHGISNISTCQIAWKTLELSLKSNIEIWQQFLLSLCVHLASFQHFLNLMLPRITWLLLLYIYTHNTCNVSLPSIGPHFDRLKCRQDISSKGSHLDEEPSFSVFRRLQGLGARPRTSRRFFCVASRLESVNPTCSTSSFLGDLLGFSRLSWSYCHSLPSVHHIPSYSGLNPFYRHALSLVGLQGSMGAKTIWVCLAGLLWNSSVSWR